MKRFFRYALLLIAVASLGVFVIALIKTIGNPYDDLGRAVTFGLCVVSGIVSVAGWIGWAALGERDGADGS
jgi:hypothetical protein